MNAKELADMLRRDADHIERFHGAVKPSYMQAMADVVELLVPKYRHPQPSDHGKWCFLEELPSDAPPTLVRSCGRSVREIVVADDVRLDYVPIYQYWTTAGWRELTGNVWPCERPESTTR